MKTNNLLASVALFSELYNSRKYENVTDIIAEFIKAVVVAEKKWSTSPNEIRILLEKVYGFDIPDAVIKSTIRNKLAKVAKNVNGEYHFNNEISDTYEAIETEILALKERQNQIIEELFAFIKGNKPEITHYERAEIEDNLKKFLMDNGVSETYTDQISAFVIKNSNKEDFKHNLNLIREGIILYQGIKYSSDLNSMGVWNTDLTIFLSPEHLFSALGYNGTLFHEVFVDFYKLVNEVNFSNKNRGNDKRIKLRYFKESSDDVNSLFSTAEDILKGKVRLASHRPAMREILKDCKLPSDIVKKKVQFYQQLSQIGISVQEFDDNNLYRYMDYNVEDQKVIDELKKEALGKHVTFDEDACRDLFRIFTKVNYFRGGQSKDKFENIGHIYITNSSLALYLAHNNKVKFEEKDIPFAKDLDYITSKLWFKLKKGLGTTQDIPRSFDVVTKAQIIIASHTEKSIYRQYEKLKSDLKSGNINVETANELNNHLRENANMPEEFTSLNIDKSLAFLTSNDSFNDYILEKEKKDKLLEDTQKRLIEMQLELDLKNAEDVERQRKEKEAKHAEDRSTYCNEKLRSEFRNNHGLAFRFGGVVVLTSGPLVFAILKMNEALNTPISKWGARLWLYFFAVLSVYLIEWIGRNYLFNREKIKFGWTWFTYYFDRNKREKYKATRHSFYENEFDRLSI